MIEVIICTYNGEQYIEDQLKSIINQSEKPDLISIYDDLSKDKTISKINSLIPLSKVKIEVNINTKQKGYRRNFLDAVFNSKADIIFLSDQDDVWINLKIETMISYFTDVSVQAVCSDSWVTKSKISDVTSNFFKIKKINFRKFNNSQLVNQFKRNSISGSCLCFKNHKVLKQIINANYNCLEHDYQLGLIFASIGEIKMVDEKLIYYRQHENNSLGIKRFNFLNKIKLILGQKNNKECIVERTILFETLMPYINNLLSLKRIRKELNFLDAMLNSKSNIFLRFYFSFSNIFWLIKTKRLIMGFNFILNGFK